MNGDSITIPANFNISSESPELVTEGMIIEDGEDNQYVWIPVFEKSTQRDWGADYSAVTSEDDWEGIKEALIKYTNPDIDSGTYTYGKANYTDEWYGDSSYGRYGYYDENSNLIYYTNGNMTKDEYDTLYQNMLKSVYKNKGFYIGRYEMGIEVVDSTAKAQTVARTGASKEYVATETNSSNEAPTIEGMNKPISKANAVAYNYITQSQAQMLAERLNYSNITSSLMFGIQWETVCVFIEHYDTRNNKCSEWITNNTYSKEWGNYYNSSFTMYRGFYSTTYRSNPVGWKEKSTTAKGTSTIWLCTTGASDKNSCLNIYDFGGNLWEYTLERYDDSNIPDVRRGGAFDGNGYASERNSYGISYSNYAYSARVSLFVE